ncbi:hypothetical protein ABW20_dc0107124 [Dactylellina cionopaga]|nr:hypothetical protein ABW20_dc0107124 [Dactylellina cionopaga]
MVGSTREGSSGGGLPLELQSGELPPQTPGHQPPAGEDEVPSLPDEVHMFVNLDLQQVLKYPFACKDDIKDVEALDKAQWDVRKGISEMLLLPTCKEFHMK